MSTTKCLAWYKLILHKGLVVLAEVFYPFPVSFSLVLQLFSESLCICNWQNVLGTHHASAHGGSSDLIVKNVGLNYFETNLVIYLRQCLGEKIPFFNCCWEEVVSKYVCKVSNLQELTVMFT